MMPAPTHAEGDLGYWDDYWHWYDNSFHPHFHRSYRINGQVGAYTTEWTAPYYGTPPSPTQGGATGQGSANYRGDALYSGMNSYWYPGDNVPVDRTSGGLRPNHPPPFYAGSRWYYGPNSYFYPGDTVPHGRLNSGPNATIVDDVGY